MGDFLIERREDGHVWGYTKTGDPSMVQRLRRGRPSIAASLDLHGYRSEEARRETRMFILSALQSGSRIVKVIHGRGLHSQDGQGVLREVVIETLTAPALGPSILAFASASPELGGRGVLLVLLKRLRATNP